ncbi:MAG: AbrB/MazE/SpoVT family DNA-binding domain-containing protein [Candidatus Bathyarchaeia archaeon]|jgi:AbrB family looped-hinge helix DNA binding protein
MQTLDVSIVKVTRRGQTTIPLEIRQKCGIKEGDRLLVELTDKGVLFKPIPKLLDMAGFMAGHGTPEEIKKEIDKLREEY